jgi:hypothetical protein
MYALWVNVTGSGWMLVRLLLHRGDFASRDDLGRKVTRSMCLAVWLAP